MASVEPSGSHAPGGIGPHEKHLDRNWEMSQHMSICSKNLWFVRKGWCSLLNFISQFSRELPLKLGNHVMFF